MGKKIKWSDPGLVQLVRNHGSKANGFANCNPGGTAETCGSGYGAFACGGVGADAQESIN